jgi:predicted dehydrogenase
MGDIGTHAFNLAEYITGLKAVEFCAELNRFVPNRLLDDDGTVMIRYEGGAKGILFASQIAVGEENNLSIRVYGEKGGLEWHQQEPNTLVLKWNDKPTEILRTAGGYLSSAAQHNTRTPGGHPEGYIEAFANIYRNFALSLQALKAGEEPCPECRDFPSVEEGVRGMQFIDTVVASSDADAKWIQMKE